MSTVAPEVRGAQPAPTPPVRHGTCRLIVVIDGTEYRLSRSPSARAAWHLKRLSEPRKGQVYCVLTHKNVVTCSCQDSIKNGAVCKHVRALKALGLVARRAKPEAVIAARHPEGGAS
jgi:SWIM zinc finger